MTVATKEITRTPSDDETLKDSAIARPLHPPLGDMEAVKRMGRVDLNENSSLFAPAYSN
ncbi:hypothetical protein [Haloferula sp. A504]|uniref:hypothetical protein n=1 Tax=Haloferula sp. A504 TaxID=3373601 RepID=UPI0031C0C7F1|nr:hypothetical protein [Verrucomicrobiaceae bacterium E54]